MINRLKGLIDARDLHLYGGTILLAAGAWLLLPALGLIAPGLVLIYVALREVN